jgi:hypothetical protein
MSTLGDLLGSANIRNPQAAMHIDAPGLEIAIDDAVKPEVDKKTGAVSTELSDGSLMIDFNPSAASGKLSETFNANLALGGGIEFGAVANELITEIEGDIASRAEWMDMREEALKLLGLKIESPRGDTGNSSAPLEGMSTIHAPTLLKAVLKFQANARGELLPAMGPIKVIDKSAGGTGYGDEWAEILETDLNVYLTQICSEYYPDTDRMLFYVGFGGSGFKKIYHCPLRRRPVSESVDANNLIVNAAATDLRNARRVTHRIRMRDSMVTRMQIAGVYRDVALSQAEQNIEQDETADIIGIDIQPQRPEDNDRVIYESLCERDFGEHPNRMPLPYKIVVDKSSQQVLEIRRNWREDDPMYMPLNMYVRYPYIEAMTIYGIGLMHTVGNLTKAMTAAMRVMLDAGMFSNFPGFLYAEGVARQETNEMRVPPGGGVRVNTGGQDIRTAVMPLPYKDVSSGLMELVESILKAADELAGTAELPTGEGIQNAPVGTTLAIIDQATKVLDAVHKRLHSAQAEEFRLLKERLLEDPEAFWRHNPDGATNWDKETFVQALQMVDLVPVADPNTPTHTHRLMKATALMQLAMQDPSGFNIRQVRQTVLRLIGFSNPDEFLADANAPQQPNPVMLKAQLDQAKLQQDGQIAQAKLQQEAQIAQGKLQQDGRRSQLDLIRAQLQQKTDQMEITGQQTLEAEKLRHAKTVDGAAMVSDAAEHLGGLGGLPSPAAAGASGPPIPPDTMQ